MPSQVQPVHLVTVDSTPEKSKALVAMVSKDLMRDYNLVHVANCEHITSVKAVLTSLIVPPMVLITSSQWFEDEQEEIREITQRILPSIHLIMIPPGLEKQEGEAGVFEYLKEQVTESRIPTRDVNV